MKIGLIFWALSQVACITSNTEEDDTQSTSLDLYPYSVEKLTSGDKQHWFGYYDKWQVDPTGRYVLGGQVDHFLRSPTPQDTLRIGIIDLNNNNHWEEIGISTAWGWQQGCMLQWIPGSTSEVIWNTHSDEGFVSKVYNIHSKETMTLPRPIYTLSPDGTYALTIDFDRLQFFRPGYGYPAKTPVKEYAKNPSDQGIYKMDVVSGESTLLVSYHQLASIDWSGESVTDCYHWFNHLRINPGGTRFIFLNRFRPLPREADMEEKKDSFPNYLKHHGRAHYATRAFTANMDGSNLYPLNESGMFSHFIWQEDSVICAWATPNDSDLPGFYDFKDHTTHYIPVGKEVMTRNGHNTYVPGTHYEWILNDTYPIGVGRLQELYLYHIPTQTKVSLGRFHEPIEYQGEFRCDLHPRASQDGRFVIFDSTHDGDGRQMYKIDIAEIIGS